MIKHTRSTLALAGMLVLMSACSAGVPNLVCVGASTTYLDWLEGTLALSEADPIEAPANPGDPADLLAIVQERGKLIISTDADYAPQSYLKPDGTFEGFDIDVGTEIADRLGVDAEFSAQNWDTITAGSWAGRWDISVGSMTISEDRKPIVSFTQPYYYTPAQMAAATSADITTLDQMPDPLAATTLATDANCAEAIRDGRTDFVFWLSSSTTVKEAIDSGIPIVTVGEPVFGEALSVAIDKSGPPHGELLYEIDRIIGEMHDDGTLTQLSNTWFGIDLTQAPPAE